MPEAEKSVEITTNFDGSKVKVGEQVTRIMGAGGPSMKLGVTAIDDELVHCGPWKFSKETGLEVDEELGWNARSSGSYLV